MTKLCMCGHSKGEHNDNEDNTNLDGVYNEGVCHECLNNTATILDGAYHQFEWEYSDPSSWTCD
tara:strand:+ start:868 stop:1059 length:192 start_codon:yes stop_codon:yes gene_type:complete